MPPSRCWTGLSPPASLTSPVTTTATCKGTSVAQAPKPPTTRSRTSRPTAMMERYSCLMGGASPGTSVAGRTTSASSTGTAGPAEDGDWLPSPDAASPSIGSEGGPSAREDFSVSAAGRATARVPRDGWGRAPGDAEGDGEGAGPGEGGGPPAPAGLPGTLGRGLPAVVGVAPLGARGYGGSSRASGSPSPCVAGFAGPRRRSACWPSNSLSIARSMMLMVWPDSPRSFSTPVPGL